MSIDLETAIRVLKVQGCGPPFICPKCRVAPLMITENGGEQTFICGGGCQGVGTYLQAVSTIPVPQGDHIDLIAKLRYDLEMPELEKVVKHGRLGSSYNLHLKDGRVVVIGNITMLTTQPKFRAAFLPQMRRNPPRFKTNDWDKIAEQIEQVAEERDAVATLTEETTSWIVGAVSDGRLRRGVNVENSEALFELLAPGVNGRPPFFDIHGALHVRLEHIIQWLGRIASIRITQPELSARLSELDFERVQHAARGSEGVRKARYWVSPPHFEDRT